MCFLAASSSMGFFNSCKYPRDSCYIAWFSAKVPPMLLPNNNTLFPKHCAENTIPFHITTKLETLFPRTLFHKTTT